MEENEMLKSACLVAMVGCATTNSSKPQSPTNPEVNVALMVRLEAKPEASDAVAKLLADGRAFVMDEAGTPYWFAVRLGPNTFGIFDAFGSDVERTQHLKGKLASALLAAAPTALSKDPSIEPVEIIGNKHAFVGACRELGVGLIVRMDAKPEHAAEVAGLLEAGEGIVADEPGTPVWFGVKISATTYAIFDAFKTSADRDAHLNGKLAQTLVAKAGELLATAPSIEPVDIIASKLP
jgi:quinol monooxygenase YgiN